MQEVFEKIIEKLRINANNSERKEMETDYFEEKKEYKGQRISFRDAIDIVNQEAEKYNNGWISFSEHQPDYGERVLLQDFGGNITLEKCERKKKVKGFTDGNWWSSANNYMAWQPLPQPYTNGE